MNGESIKNTSRDAKIKKISLGIEIPKVLELPEFNPKERKLKQASGRIRRALLNDAYENEGIKTLRDLKKYIEENGWFFSIKYVHLPRFGRMGKKSVEYFNEIMSKYEIEPFGPLYEIDANAAKNQSLRKRKITMDTTILEFLGLPELDYEPGRKKIVKSYIKEGLQEAKESLGIKNLGDLKKYIEENGWLFSIKYVHLPRFGRMGKKSVEYFNEITSKYEIEPFQPLYKD